MSNPELLKDPEVMQAMQDPTLMQKLNYYQQTGNIQAMFADPQVTALMQKIQGKMKKEEPNTNKEDNMEDVKETSEPVFEAPKEEQKRQEPKKEVNTSSEVLKIKEEATKLFKQKKYTEAIEVYKKCQELDSKDKT